MTRRAYLPRSVRLLRTQSHAGFYRQTGKRAFDVLVCCLMLPFIAPLIGLLLCIAAVAGPSGFFAHPRVGKGGRVFKCWKIRTMGRDADRDLRAALTRCAHLRKEWSEKRKLSNDPRILPFGRFLRRTSLDELPQIWNVIVGDMSLVGPRPVTRAELHHYKASKAKYLALRPGITGLWQIAGRRSGCYVQRVNLDVAYLARMSFSTDLAILAKTLPEVIRRSGS